MNYSAWGQSAIRWLKKAIALHEGHMNGSVPTSRESQKELMRQLRNALTVLEEDGLQGGGVEMPSGDVMPLFEARRLHSGKGGKIVRKKKQAKAILLSYLRREGRSVPAYKSGGRMEKM